MKLLILAAGYATRLYPLTRNKAKPLLEVAGRPIIEHVLASVENVSEIDDVFVVTNAKFAADFENWAQNFAQKHKNFPPIRVINDGSTSDADKLGAIGDIALVLTTAQIDDDLLVIGGDNLLEGKLDNFITLAKSHGPSVGVYDIGDPIAIKHYGNIATDSTGRIVFFEEKPEKPRGTLASMCLYFYPRETLSMFERYLKEGNNPDQPGRIIQWLYEQMPVYAFEIEGKWLDIGSRESLEQASREFAPPEARR
jgi:glucose-1-phosphate thymidylyltransferase